MRKIKIIVFSLGINLIKLYSSLKYIPDYISEYLKIKRNVDNNFVFSFLPILSDKMEDAGKIDKQYFYQDVFVARKIFEAAPSVHYDIGSRVDAFIGHLLVFMKVNIIDIRPLEINEPNASFFQMDCMNIPNELFSTCDSLSSLHAIEHFGLGRYGDPIDYFGHLKAFNGISNFLKPGGVFYFSTPISDNQRLEFNAHRVFSVKYLLNCFGDSFIVKEFSYIDDHGIFNENIDINSFIESEISIEYGCGIFILIRR